MKKQTTLEYLLEHVSHTGDDCLIWPHSRDDKGYGQVCLGKGVVKKAHRYMCELIKGPPPTPKHQASHDCGKGHLGCFNPRHLSWKTNSENQLDRRRHGTHHGSKGGRTRLTPEQIAEMRRLKGVESRVKIAKRMGVKRGCVQYWQTPDDDPKPFSNSYSAIYRRTRNANRSQD